MGLFAKKQFRSYHTVEKSKSSLLKDTVRKVVKMFQFLIKIEIFCDPKNFLKDFYSNYFSEMTLIIIYIPFQLIDLCHLLQQLKNKTRNNIFEQVFLHCFWSVSDLMYFLGFKVTLI